MTHAMIGVINNCFVSVFTNYFLNLNQITTYEITVLFQ